MARRGRGENDTLYDPPLRDDLLDYAMMQPVLGLSALTGGVTMLGVGGEGDDEWQCVGDQEVLQAIAELRRRRLEEQSTTGPPNRNVPPINKTAPLPKPDPPGGPYPFLAKFLGKNFAWLLARVML